MLGYLHGSCAPCAGQSGNSCGPIRHALGLQNMMLNEQQLVIVHDFIYRVRCFNEDGSTVLKMRMPLLILESGVYGEIRFTKVRDYRLKLLKFGYCLVNMGLFLTAVHLIFVL